MLFLKGSGGIVIAFLRIAGFCLLCYFQKPLDRLSNQICWATCVCNSEFQYPTGPGCRSKVSFGLPICLQYYHLANGHTESDQIFGSGVVLDCIISWYLPSFLLTYTSGWAGALSVFVFWSPPPLHGPQVSVHFLALLSLSELLGITQPNLRAT